MSCMLHKQVLQWLLVTLFHTHTHTHTHTRARTHTHWLPSGSGPSTLAAVPCRQLQYSKARAVATTEQHCGRCHAAQGTWETVRTSHLEILSKPVRAAIQQAGQERSVYAGWKGMCMRVCSVVSNFAILWTAAPPRDCSTWLLCPWDPPVKNTGVGCHFLLQGSSCHPTWIEAWGTYINTDTMLLLLLLL